MHCINYLPKLRWETWRPYWGLAWVEASIPRVAHHPTHTRYLLHKDWLKGGCHLGRGPCSLVTTHRELRVIHSTGLVRRWQLKH